MHIWSWVKCSGIYSRVERGIVLEISIGVPRICFRELIAAY